MLRLGRRGFKRHQHQDALAVRRERPLTDLVNTRIRDPYAGFPGHELQLTAMGCSNAHLESRGDFGMAWTQLGASLDMVKPVPGVFLAEATPWSPATQGPAIADVIHVPGLNVESDLAAWKGKLKGKIILYGLAPASPDVDPDSVPTMEHYDPAKLKDLSPYPLKSPENQTQFFRKIFAAKAFQEKVAKFFAAEGAIAVLEPYGSPKELLCGNELKAEFFGLSI